MRQCYVHGRTGPESEAAGLVASQRFEGFTKTWTSTPVSLVYMGVSPSDPGTETTRYTRPRPPPHPSWSREEKNRQTHRRHRGRRISLCRWVRLCGRDREDSWSGGTPGATGGRHRAETSGNGPREVLEYPRHQLNLGSRPRDPDPVSLAGFLVDLATML